jgi:hypothetical protein
MKRILRMPLAALAIALHGGALACGACVEDKVAATYDHAVIRGAIERHQDVLFVAIDGADATVVERRLAQAARGLRGADAKTLRLSASPAAFSIAVDRSQSSDRVVRSLQEALREPGAQLTLVRVMRDGALIEPR